MAKIAHSKNLRTVLEKARKSISSKSKTKTVMEIDPNRLRGEEGDRWINAHIVSKTDLGFALALESEIPFEIPGFGTFNSIQNMLAYVSSGCYSPALKTLDVSSLKKTISEKKIRLSKVEHRPRLVAYALWCRLNQYPELLEQFKEYKGSFKIFDEHPETGYREVPRYANWYARALRILRAAMVHGEEVFTFENDGITSPTELVAFVIDKALGKEPLKAKKAEGEKETVKEAKKVKDEAVEAAADSETEEEATKAKAANE